MKGLRLKMTCQLCDKTHEIEQTVGVKLELPKPWLTRNSSSVREDARRLYPGWKGGDADVLPRLFCSLDHKEAFETAENAAVKAAGVESLKVAKQVFRKVIEKGKLVAMDAVTALATVVHKEAAGDGGE